VSDTPEFAAPANKLPPRPNLEHLKNEAKQRLKNLRAQNPAARLAEAQLLVARSYGFPSWRNLKSHVDAMNDSAHQLVDAVRLGDLETMRALLDRHPDLVNASAEVHPAMRPTDTLTMRLIHLAIAEAQPGALCLLIERGADINARNAHGRLPLHDCFELDHDDFAKILLGAGAVPDVCAAAAYGLHDQLEDILAGNPELANDLSTGNSPLGWSVFGRQLKSAEILFEHGAIADRPPYDASAWGPAAMVASTVVTPVLLQHGANPNWRDGEGNTPIHRAIKSRLILDPAPFIQILLDSGADPGTRNNQGHTPLDEAEALLKTNANAETYFPVRPVGPKRLEQTIAILRSREPHTP
jgi:ankyrin repeat protein